MIFIVWERIKLWRSLKTRDIWLLLEIRLQTSPNQWASLFLYTFILNWSIPSYSGGDCIQEMKALLRWIFSDAFPSSSSFPKDSALILPTPGIDSSVYMTFHDDPSGLPLNGNNIIETRVGPSVISIFEFLLRAHHSQAESTLQALFHRLTLLSPGNHSLLFVKTKYFTCRTCPPPLFIS